MYCPKCGTENQDNLVYCRSCGEDLKVISQVMKKHLPIAIVSKLDAAIEKKNERFRRDFILYGFAGPILLFSTIFMLLGGSFLTFFNLFISLFGIWAVFTSGWNFLAYRRSLELRKKPLSTSINDKILPSDISQINDIGAATNKLVAVNNFQTAYCPRCGVQNLENLLYCRDCGTNLDFGVPLQGMERYLPGSLVNKLDTAIAKNEETNYNPQYKSGSALFFIGASYLLNVILTGAQGNIGAVTLNLVLGFVLVITGGWDLIAYRRNLEKENKSLEEPSTIGSELVAFLSINRKIVVAIFGVILICFGLLYFGIAQELILKLSPPVIFLGIIVFIGLILKFEQHLRLQKDKEFFEDTSELPTNELLQEDALPITAPLLSITEGTTKPLNLEAQQIKQEEVLTNQNSTKSSG